MLLYLASNSRPDIAFAVPQCARFSHCPCATHEKAVKKICRYLKGSFDQGISVLLLLVPLTLNVIVTVTLLGSWVMQKTLLIQCVLALKLAIS